MDFFSCCAPIAVPVARPVQQSAASTPARSSSVFDILPLSHRPESGRPSQPPLPSQSPHRDVQKAFHGSYQAQAALELEAQAKADKAARMLQEAQERCQKLAQMASEAELARKTAELMAQAATTYDARMSASNDALQLRY